MEFSLYHAVPYRRVGENISPPAQAALLDEMDRAAAILQRDQNTMHREFVVQFFLERGAGPNELDGNQTISLYTFTSMHMVAAKSDAAFSKQAKQWFEVTKLIILLHAASTDAICLISIKSGKVEERVNLRKITSPNRWYSTWTNFRYVGESYKD